MKKLPQVSVVMSNYNGIELKLLPEALTSILRNNYPNLEIILVDNASTDNSVEVLKKKFAKDNRLKIIQNPVNMYSQGLNLGVENAAGKYIAFFNNDVFIKDDFFQKFIKFLEENPKIALAQGKIVSFYNHNIIDSAGETMDSFGNPITIGAGMRAKENFNEIDEVLSVSGSCSILRKSCVEKIGYFDKDFGIGYEDLDLALRVHLVGFKVVYFPKALAYHKRAVTDVAPYIRPTVKWHFNKNRLAMMIKNYPLSFLIRTLPITLLIYMFAGFWETFVKRSPRIGFKRLTSIGWVIYNMSGILRKRKQVSKLSHKNFPKIKRLLYKRIFLESFLTFLKIREPS